MKQDLNDMAYFAAVVQHKGFTAAGRALGLSKSLLSRRIADLENRLGLQLLNRSSRQFSVTDIGLQYAEQCRRMLEQAEIAQQLIDDRLEHPKGRLTVSAPVTMTETFMAPLIAEFLKEHEEVELDLLSLNRDVDLIEEGIDIVICVKPLPLRDSGLHFRALSKQRDVLVASPDFIAKYPELTSIQQLRHLPALTRKDDGQVWTLEHAHEGVKKIPIKPRLTSNNLIVQTQAAIHGLGVVMLPTIIYDYIKGQGILQQVFEGWHSQESLVHAVFASNKGRSSAFRAFMDYMLRYFTTPQKFLEGMAPPDWLQPPRDQRSGSGGLFPPFIQP